MKNMKSSIRGKILKSIKEVDVDNFVDLVSKNAKDQGDIYEICKKVLNTHRKGNKEKRDNAFKLITALEKQKNIDYFKINKEDSFMNIFKHAVRLDIESLVVHVINQNEDIKIYENMKMKVFDFKKDEDYYNMSSMRASEDFFFTLIEQKNKDALELLMDKGYMINRPYSTRHLGIGQNEEPILNYLVEIPDLINKFYKTKYFETLTESEKRGLVKNILKSQNNLDNYMILLDEKENLISDNEFYSYLNHHFSQDKIPKRIKKEGIYKELLSKGDLKGNAENNLTLDYLNESWMLSLLKNPSVDNKLLEIILKENSQFKNCKQMKIKNKHEELNIQQTISVLSRSIFLNQKDILAEDFYKIREDAENLFSSLSINGGYKYTANDVVVLEKLIEDSIKIHVDTEKRLINNNLSQDLSTENKMKKRL